MEYGIFYFLQAVILTKWKHCDIGNGSLPTAVVVSLLNKGQVSLWSSLRESGHLLWSQHEMICVTVTYRYKMHFLLQRIKINASHVEFLILKPYMKLLTLTFWVSLIATRSLNIIFSSSIYFLLQLHLHFLLSNFILSPLTLIAEPFKCRCWYMNLC